MFVLLPLVIRKRRYSRHNGTSRSVADRSALFVGFTVTMARSDDAPYGNNNDIDAMEAIVAATGLQRKDELL
jgi:hypothetical protein